MFDGENLERWALKVLLGLGVSSNLAASEDGERLGPRVPELYLRILFDEEALPERCGFFYVGDPIKLMDGDALNVKFMTYPEGDPEVGKVYGVILKLRFFKTDSSSERKATEAALDCAGTTCSREITCSS